MPERPTLIVAAATPLAGGGSRLDEAAIGPMVAFLESHGADGIFACGTTGEGVLLTIDERRRAAEAFRQAVRGSLIVHCGAQTTADTMALADHAARAGADAAAVIAPPYFPLDADALTAHFVAAARACAPLPFYCYAFAARSGYPLSVEVIERIWDQVNNLAGLKVSESPWEAVEPYLSLGLPVFVGFEPLIPRALAAGAVGAVSGVAAAFPDVVRAALDDPDAAGSRLQELRAAMGAHGPLIAAVKHVLVGRGIPMRPDVRAPLRRLTDVDAAALDAQLAELQLSPQILAGEESHSPS